MIDVTADLAKAYGSLAHIEGGAPRAISSALNRTIDGVKTDIVREVVSKYDIKPGKVRETIKVKKSNPSTLLATVEAAGSPIPLEQFNVKPGSPGTPLTASVKRSGGRPIPGAFQPHAKGAVLARIGKERLPFKHLYGPAVTQMMGEPGINEAVMAGAGERFAKRVDHEIDRLLAEA